MSSAVFGMSFIVLIFAWLFSWVVVFAKFDGTGEHEYENKIKWYAITSGVTCVIMFAIIGLSFVLGVS
jgi:hypothetical protein